MSTRVLTVNRDESTAQAVADAVAALNASNLVAFPTETVYGVGARADLPGAMAKLRLVKSRESHRALTLHIGTASDADRYVAEISGVARRFMAKAWPGPLTLIFPVSDTAATAARAEIDPAVARNLYFDDTIGIRCPDDPIASAILTGADGPVVASSANNAGNPPPWTGADVLRDLEGRIDLLIDAGQTRYAKPSTIVRLTGDGYDLVREGVYDAGIMERMAALRILFVCTGNTCRSVMAEALARKMIAERLGCAIDELASRGIHVASAGVNGGHGGATDHAITVMNRQGLDVSRHVSTGLTRDMIHQSDHVFAMTESHLRRIVELDPSASDRSRTLFDGEDVRDPVGGSADDYQRCAESIEQGLRARLERIDL